MWLSKREDKEVLALLDAENAYSAARTAHLAPFREALYREHLSHIQETDETAPLAEDGKIASRSLRLFVKRVAENTEE